MLHLPKFVRERLKASVSRVGHPDPDVLTAFSERSLPTHERAVVMEHVARCGECRDVVALALPAPEEAAILRPEPQRDWLRWPALRWGAVAAGLLIIGSIGIQQYRERHEPVARFVAGNQAEKTTDQVARNETPKAEMRVPPAVTQPVPLPPQPEAAAPRHELAPSGAGTSSNAIALSQPQTVGQLRQRVAVGGTLGGPIVGGQGGSAGQGTKLAMNLPPKGMFDAARSGPAPQAKQVPSSEPSRAPVLPPSASEVVEVEGAAAPVATQDQPQGQRQDQVDYQAQQQQTNGEQLYAENDKALSKAKPASQQAEVNSAIPGAATGAPGPVIVGRNMATVLAATWTITSTGGLQRSFDNGKTWQDVNVAAYPPSVSNLMQTAESVTVVSRAQAGKEQKSNQKKDAKLAKQANFSPTFRAVSANGSDVWAGGSAGALYHSIDSGDHWTRIFPFAGSVLLTADITSVQFSDPLRGTITTATPETWTTTDGGHSWQKQ